jgi:ATP-dependent DNA helicase DinG
MRGAIRMAGGREVCFAATMDEQGIVRTARVVARGDAECVLALPGAAARGEIVLHNHPSGLLEPSEADLRIAARLHDDGVGFGIIDNDASDLYVVVEIPRPPRVTPLDPAEVDDALGPGGPIAARLERYEDRAGQRQMARAIAQLYNEGGVGLLEAGTGIGKSLAYLLPALRWAAANGERTVVSTNTINLQEQLVGVDLPFLAGALGGEQPVRFALLKGWRNYLCLLRLEQARASGNALFEESLAGEIEALEGWAESTKDGSRSDLPVEPRPEVWDEVAAEPDLCTRFKCAHHARCFVFAARKQAAQADVIVANHHLLLSDLAVRRAAQNWSDAAVLPPYARLVVDEGHHLEDAAAKHLGATVTRAALQRLFGRLDRRGRGLLTALRAQLAFRADLLSVASLDLVNGRLAPSATAARDKAGLVFDLLATVLHEHGEATMRLTGEFASHVVWRGGLDAALTDLLQEIGLLEDGLRMVRERMATDESLDDSVPQLLNEIQGVARRLTAAGDALTAALRPPADSAPTVRWIEVRGRERNVAVSSVPLDLAPILREDLFSRVRTAIVTSATLAPESRFDFLARRLGLTTRELTPRTAIFPSPFEYRSQAILAIPTDFPAPNVDADGHFRATVGAVTELAEASDGGLFVLFTSHRGVRQAAAELRARGIERRWPLLIHGEDGRDALLRRFRASGRALLLGTASFWEGVDVAGQALRGLVIPRLPFRVPSEPITAANCEAIEARGGDPFTEYMLPHASLRLKQGFGRLIRTTVDRGVILLGDPRAVTKGYGRGLIDALPPARRLVAPWARIAGELRIFYLTAASGQLAPVNLGAAPGTPARR